MTAKDRIHQIVDQQPDDSSFDEILQELAFNRMIKRGLEDVQNGRTITSDELTERMKSWRKKA